METAPLRDITREEIATYEREGFVKLPGILPLDWVATLRDTIDDMMAAKLVSSQELDELADKVAAGGGKLLSEGEARPKGRFAISTDQWREVPKLGRLCQELPLPLIAAQLFGSRKVNFLIDQIFTKEPGASRRTAFHSDESYFCCTGEQCATFWIPVDVVDDANAPMGYVPRSHLWRTLFKRNVFVNQDTDPTSEGERLPDIEGNEEKFGVVYLEAAPGDILVHHYRTIHGSRGNIDPSRYRRSAGLRYGGDDLRYVDRKFRMRSAVLKPGDTLDSNDFPVVWRAGETVA